VAKKLLLRDGGGEISAIGKTQRARDDNISDAKEEEGSQEKEPKRKRLHISQNKREHV